MKLEVEGSASAVLFRKSGRILRQTQSVNVAVSRRACTRVEQERGLVMTGIRAPVPYRLKDFSAENSGPVAQSRAVLGDGVLCAVAKQPKSKGTNPSIKQASLRIGTSLGNREWDNVARGPKAPGL